MRIQDIRRFLTITIFNVASPLLGILVLREWGTQSEIESVECKEFVAVKEMEDTRYHMYSRNDTHIVQGRKIVAGFDKISKVPWVSLHVRPLARVCDIFWVALC